MSVEETENSQIVNTTSSTSMLRKDAGSWLREKRCALGLSQRELAAKVNMEYYTFISQIEAGRGRVPSERYEDWAKALEIDPRDFAINLMKYYDPHTFDLVFGSKTETSRN